MALFQMNPTKARDPNGFPVMFYKVHWDLVQDMVCEAVKSFLDGNDISEGFCDSVIVLIPKVTNTKASSLLASTWLLLSWGLAAVCENRATIGRRWWR
jgi:hypothetical protein